MSADDYPENPPEADIPSRNNATHTSTTDPDAHAALQEIPWHEGMLCFMGHVLMENRNGLIVQSDLTEVGGHGERKAALDLIHLQSPGSTRRPTLGGDKGFDAAAPPGTRVMLGP